MSDLPHVDSVMGCGLEHSNRTSGQAGPHKDPLVLSVVPFQLPGRFACHVALCDNKSPMPFSSSSIILWFRVFNVNRQSHLLESQILHVCCFVLLNLLIQPHLQHVCEWTQKVSYFSLEITHETACVRAVCLLKKLMSWRDVLWTACRVCVLENSRSYLCWWRNEDVWPGWNDVLRPDCCSPLHYSSRFVCFQNTCLHPDPWPHHPPPFFHKQSICLSYWQTQPLSHSCCSEGRRDFYLQMTCLISLLILKTSPNGPQLLWE